VIIAMSEPWGREPVSTGYFYTKPKDRPIRLACVAFRESILRMCTLVCTKTHD
jgi:hypothetical protein